jgi:hypothetical protein
MAMDVVAARLGREDKNLLIHMFAEPTVQAA